jgi:hypothetical protein
MNLNRPTDLPISIPVYLSYWPICRFSTSHIWNLNSEQFSTNFISFHSRSDSQILLTVPPAAQFHNWLFLPISYESAAPVPFCLSFPTSPPPPSPSQARRRRRAVRPAQLYSAAVHWTCASPRRRRRSPLPERREIRTGSGWILSIGKL